MISTHKQLQHILHGVCIHI